VLRGRPRTGGRGGPIADLFYDEDEFGPGEHPFASPYAGRFTTMLIEPGTFLFRVMDDVLLRGGRMVVRELHALDEVLTLEEALVVNCTGLGARALFGDQELRPIKGQLVVLLPQPEVDYVTLAGGSYMFPRSDGIVLGGSQEMDDWTPRPTEPVVARILEGNRAVFEGMTGAGA
jgi:D-amino-acid oxidase